MQPHPGRGVGEFAALVKPRIRHGRMTERQRGALLEEHPEAVSWSRPSTSAMPAP
ncbi:hypothetical protein [Mycobacterium sp. E2479]|uniref:hypothetical protein n=1 Tax=Mycobacterium sp. E2479 TaxID=1834134 RepID=UPI000A548AA4